MSSEQSNNPLHGIKLADMLDTLHTEFGWDGLAERIDLNCFKREPATIKSCLRFLRKTPWARAKVEKLYLKHFPDGEPNEGLNRPE